MKMDGLIKDRFTMLAALGAGVVVGVSGIYLYHKSTKRIVKELHHINHTINKLRCEIESLKATSPKTAPLPDDSIRNDDSNRKTYHDDSNRQTYDDSNRTTYHSRKVKTEKTTISEPIFTTTYSSEDDEFYDISDEEGGEYTDSTWLPTTVDQSQGYSPRSPYSQKNDGRYVESARPSSPSTAQSQYPQKKGSKYVESMGPPPSNAQSKGYSPVSHYTQRRDGDYVESEWPPPSDARAPGYSPISQYAQKKGESLEDEVKITHYPYKVSKEPPSSLKGIHRTSRPRVHFDVIDEMLDSSSLAKDEVFLRLKGMKDEKGDDPEYLWRMAKATHLMSLTAKRNKDKEELRELSFEAYEYAKLAMALVDNNPEVHKWYAITLGSLSEYVSTQEKLNNGIKFKEHVEIALSLKKDDPTLYHMLGRWYFEVASLSWIERKAAATLFSAVPEATFTDAISLMYKAKELKPDWKENLLFLAKAYFGNREYREGLDCIEEALSLPEDGEDPLVWQELTDLRDKYEAYG